jgi:M6 family metalloprotease-like protein
MGAALSLAWPLLALQPPRPGEILQWKESGQFGARLEFAKKLGNDKVAPYLVERLRAKLQQEFLKSQGLSAEEAEQQAPLPAPPGGGGMPRFGTVRVLAILVDFPDFPHTVSENTIHNMLFGTGNSSHFPRESLTNYYERSSYGQLHITGNTLGWYRTAYDRSTIDTNSAASRDNVIKEVLNFYNGQGHDYTQYDNDGDGDIDYFIVLWSGPDTGWSSFWWGYQTSFSDGGYTVDGKKLSLYSWQWESDRPTVVIHETGHALGLPDYYDYDDTVGPDGGLGGLDMMDGNWGDHNCFSKWMLDWITPTVVSSCGNPLTLNASGSSQDAVLIWPGITLGDLFSEFFMVQNRFRVQNDANYPNDGLLIWHVDSTLDGGNFKYNNSYTARKLIRLMEADGLEEIEAGGGADAGDYYVAGKKFTPYSKPSSAKYDGTPSCVRVGNISPSGSVMTAGFCTSCTVPEMTVPGDVQFGDTCLGTTNTGTLYVCNTGNANLEVGEIVSTNPRFRVVPPSSGFPVVISPDFCFPFRVQFAPTAAGDQATTFVVSGNDPITPTNRVQGFGRGVRPNVAVFMADGGNFGDVCVGAFRDLNLTVNNAGGCPLVITGLGSLSGHFVVPVVVNYPLVVQPGDSLAVPIRFEPASLGFKTGTILVTNNDPVVPVRMLSVSGNVPPGDVRVTGSTDFGEVCAGTLAEKTISVCNVGKCNLLVSNVLFLPACADFQLINNPFPAVVSPDSCVDVVIRYTPTSCGSKSCTLVVITDDPDTPVIQLAVTASTPCGAIDVPPDLAFPPTVINSFGPCRTDLPFPISNVGTCPLWITDIVIGGPQGAEYSLIGRPSYPIILEPGHIVGEGDLLIGFAPAALGRERRATITVTYVADPVTGATASVTRQLCGEGVQTGARVLVMQGGIPLAKVEKIQLQRINANRNKDPLDTHDVIQNALLVTVVPTPPCEPFQYHREYGTVSNPVQLLPGSYQVTVSAIINGKRKSRTVGFDLSTCEFNPTVVIQY